MKLANKLALLAAAVGAPAALGQSTHLLYGVTTGDLYSIDSELGCAIAHLGSPNLGPGLAVRDVEPVGGEYWFGTDEGLYRVDRATLGTLGVTLQDHRIFAIVPRPTGGSTAFALHTPSATWVALEVNATGMPVASTPAAGAVTDAVALGADYAAILDNEVQRLDGGTYATLGIYVTGAQALANAAGSAYLPETLAVLPGGNLVVNATINVVVADSNGAARQLYNVGLYERAGVSVNLEELCVISVDGAATVDLPTGRAASSSELAPTTSSVRVSSYPVQGGGAPARLCPSGVNSTGMNARASLLAHSNVDRRALSLVASRMPAGQLAIPFYGAAGPSVPLGTGSLCVDTTGGNLRRSPAATIDSAGGTTTPFTFATAGLGLEFMAGTIWTFQVAFRDPAGAGVDVTDAVTFTFQP